MYYILVIAPFLRNIYSFIFHHIVPILRLDGFYMNIPNSKLREEDDHSRSFLLLFHILSKVLLAFFLPIFFAFDEEKQLINLSNEIIGFSNTYRYHSFIKIALVRFDFCISYANFSHSSLKAMSTREYLLFKINTSILEIKASNPFKIEVNYSINII